MVGQHFSFLVLDESMPDAATDWADVASQPDQVLHRIYMQRRKDGTTFRAEVTAIGLTEDGRFVGAHGAARDISERDRLERDLRRQAGELAVGEERAHLARELHDSVTQALFSMTLVVALASSCCSTATRTRPGRSWPSCASSSARRSPRCAR